MFKRFVILILLCSVVFAQQPYRILNSFNSGELWDGLRAREDLSKFQSGCSVMENMLPLPQGGAQKRTGTKYVATAKDAAAVRLLPFQFSTTQSYIIEAGNQYMRFFTSNAQVLDGAGTESAATIDAAGTVVGQWNLNDNLDGSTTVVERTSTHNGTMASSVATSTVHATGKVGTGSFDLDEQYAFTIADNNAFSFTDDSDDSAFSIAAWVNVTTNDVVQTIMSKWQEDVDREWRLSLSADKKLQLHLADETDTITAVSQWTLNDAAADTVILDSSGVQNGVASANTDTLAATGKISGAIDFSGTAYITIANSGVYSFGDGSNDSAFSLAAWVFFPATGSGNTVHIIDKWDTDKLEWSLHVTPADKLEFMLHDESASATLQLTADDALTVGWHFVVATYDATEDVTGMTLYVDGAAIDTTGQEIGGTYVAMEVKLADVMIGAALNAGVPHRFWPDKIDNAMIVASELSASKILGLYNSGNGTESLAPSNPNAITDVALGDGWRFVCATYNAPADETTAADGIALYVDGAVVSSTATNVSTYTAMQNGGTSLKIGAQEDSAAALQYIFNDKIDVPVLFSTELSAAQVATLRTTAAYEITTPYLTADLFELKLEQSADVLYLTHPDYETRKLSRIGNTNWTLTVTGIKNGPFRSQNSTVTSTITASATTGNGITLTASGGTPFVAGATAGHEPSGSDITSKSQTGAVFRMIHPLDTLAFSGTLTDDYPDSAVEGTSWIDCGTIFKGGGWVFETGGTWLGVMEVQRNYTIGAAVGATGWETVYQFPSTTTAKNILTATRTEDDGDADYRVICTLFTSGNPVVYLTTDQTEVVGIVEITSVTSPTSATGNVIKTLGSTDASYKWSEGAWSNYRGWPQTVAFYEDRLVFGGNDSQPDTIWGSVTGDYDNMLAGANDSDAIVFTLTSRQVNAIQWLVGKDKILIGTSGAEWTINGGTGEPLTPSNVKAEQHSTYGSADLQATLANDSVLFFQRNAKRMRELAFNWELDSYVAPDMTILAKEVTGTGITDTAFQQIPDGILWCIKKNGDIATFSYERKENVTAWSRQLTDGDFESVAVIAGTNEDEVWVSVQRDIDGDTTARYIEYFPDRDFGSDLDDAYFVDSGKTYDSTATTTITGLTHLEGETVSVFADSIIQTAQVVSGGQITITSASTVQSGLPFTVQMRTMPLSWLGQGGTIHGRMKRISEIIASWYLSGDFSIGRDASTLQTRSVTGMTTDEDRVTFPAGWDRNGYVFVYQQSPEPLTLLALMIEFETQ